MLDCVTSKVSEEMNVLLTATVSMEEIKTAAMKMGGLKAPGPDGFQGIFYQSQWDIIAFDVNNMIVDLMNGSLQPLRINATHLALIPKVQNPESVSQFRRISLCNYSYKIFSKVLANQLKRLLPVLISATQNAFVEGRQIQDNVGIAHELFHFLKNRKTKCNFELGIKLDMHKAYDRVEWDFLMAVMEKMGFNSRWRSLIMGCISTVNFSILLIGQPGSKFTPLRGLRHGDPLSLYLFLLVSEVIDEYCSASGQHVNKSKSSVFFGGNVPEPLSIHLATIIGMEKVGDPRVYLGVPAIWGRSKRSGLAYVKGRLLGKFQGWKHSTLSQAGREVLIKAVAQAVLAYPMNLFKFPKIFCNDLDALISKFWWGQKEGENRIHWVSKEQMGKSKEEGGLGLRCFTEFNDALLAKQCTKNGRWDIDFLKPFLMEDELKAIYETHSGDPILKYRLVWPFVKHGIYSVKSGYHWAMTRTRQQRIGNPHRSALIPKQTSVRNNMLSYVATTCWYIWKARCNFLINQQPIFPRQIIAVITHYVAAFKEFTQVTVISLPSSVNGSTSDVHWSPPCVGFIKINVDASWLRSGGSGFVGVVARVDTGRFVAANRMRVTASSVAVAVAEALAVLHGCEFGRNMGWNFVIVESDSQESISCIRDLDTMGSWEAFPILARCKRMGEAFNDCRWSWVPRSANMASDLLASRQSREYEE
ncbi:unnamed protein product [Malus baccata var. baccata]